MMIFSHSQSAKATKAFISKWMKISQTQNSTEVLFLLQSTAKHLVGTWSYSR